MLQKYMGNVTQLYGKCVKYYMGSVLLGSDTQPICYEGRRLMNKLLRRKTTRKSKEQNKIKQNKIKKNKIKK